MGVRIEPDAIPPVNDEAFAVWHVNWDSVTMFLRCETQWDVIATMAGFIRNGLKYEGVKALFDLLDVQRDIFLDLQEMERAALSAFREAQE